MIYKGLSDADVSGIPEPKSVYWSSEGWEVRTGDDYEAPIPLVPVKVTRRQFKWGLSRLGIRQAVEAWRASLDTSTQAGQDAADWYDESNDVERNNPMLNAMAAQFGLSPAQVDAAFIMMAGL